MRWRQGRRSSHAEDRQERRIPGGIKGGGIGTIVLVLVAMYFGVDPRVILQGVGGAGLSAPPPPPRLLQGIFQ